MARGKKSGEMLQHISLSKYYNINKGRSIKNENYEVTNKLWIAHCSNKNSEQKGEQGLNIDTCNQEESHIFQEFMNIQTNTHILRIYRETESQDAGEQGRRK